MLDLRRAMISTGGVAYFEYEATVAGNAELPLEVRLDQVDDVMKSIVVYDDEGGIGEISLPGQEPLREVFREMPFGPEALGSPVALLNALRGAEIQVTGDRTVRGRVLGVTQEQVRLPDNGGVVVRHRVGVMTASGVRQLILESAETIAFSDPHLQGQVQDALESLADNSRQDRRTLTVTTQGETERTLRVGYVIEAPLWKTSYRLTLSDDVDAEAGAVQGWAVVENLSGEDWNGIELTVVSGNPVTFRQSLYQAYYVDRPEVPVEVLGRVLPRADEGAAFEAEDLREMRDESMALRSVRAMPQAAMAMSAPMEQAAEMDVMADGLGAGGFGNAAAPAPTPEMAQVTAAESTDAATQVVYRVPRPVTVPNGHSLLVPIVAQQIPTERVSLYQPETHPLHPLASVRLTNDTGSGLPPGILTLFERPADGQVTYLGDARLNPLPDGESRLVSFAVDQKVKIDRDTEAEDEIVSGSIRDGVLRLSVKASQTTHYAIAGAATEKRIVLLEHPRASGWELARPTEAEVTSTHYRIRQVVDAGETVTVPVVLEQTRQQRLQLVNLDTSQIQFYVRARNLTASVRDALAQLPAYMQAITEAREALRGLEQDRDEITRDQNRVRENLRSVPNNSDLHRRYLRRMSDQEDQMEQVMTAIDQAQERLTQAERDLRTYARGVTVD